MDVDSLLDASAPALAPRTPALRDELTALAEAAETSVRPRRGRRRMAIVGGAVAAVLAGTAATTAAVGPRAWTSWLSGEGHGTCQMEIMVGPAGPDALGGEPNKWPDPFPYARRDRMVAEARAFADSFDYGGIDQAQAVRVWQAQETKTIAREKANNGRHAKPDEPVDPPQPKLSGDQLTSTAITTWMLDKLDAHLAAEGYDMSNHQGSDRFLMVAATGTRCE